jgi:small subunit ribosomal protein S3Ae
MPAKKQKKKSVDAWKTKKWFIITAPKDFGEKELGQTMAAVPEELIGRTSKNTLRDITGNMSHQNVQLKFKITDVKGQTAVTELIGAEVMRGYMERQARRMRAILPTVFTVATKDEKKLQMTVVPIGRHKLRVAQEKAVRKILVDGVTAAAKQSNYHAFIQDAVTGKLSADLQKDVKKIFPAQRIEIAKATLLTSPELGTVQAPEAVEKIEAEMPKPEKGKKGEEEAPDNPEEGEEPLEAEAEKE